MIRRVLFACMSSLLLVTAAGFASEGGEPNLFAGDIGNAFWTLLIFFTLIVVLGKFAWGPLLGALQQREQFIRDSLVQARDEREAAEKMLAEYTEKLESAKVEAKNLIETGRAGAENVRLRIEQEAREEAEKVADRAKREIELAKQAAIKEIYSTTAGLATEIASRIVKRELSPADHERLIAESIQELGRLDRN